MIKIGDKVRFLNSVGGGVVKRFINKELVAVEEDDGFEMPVLIKECVIIASAGEVTAENRGTNINNEKLKLDEKAAIIKETKEGEKLNIALAYIPQDSRSLSNTDFDAYLVNDSNYYLFFTYMNKFSDQWRTRFAGVIEPNTKIHLERFSKEILNELENLCVQLTAYKKQKSFDLKNPVSVELRLDTVKFYKLHSFKANDYFVEDALVYPVVRDDMPVRQIQISPEELKKALYEKNDLKSNKPAKQHEVLKQKNGIIEVDLHINQLLDSIVGMSNGDILNYQLEAFRKIINEYRGKRGQKIVFIHGKGEGVLRNAILKEITSKYSGYGCQDASFREYGFGATMVTVR
ncbi:MAG: DUF2027 domain-containing protein [Bacteroidales bacterium]|nr:DUF2027 domain-containing protein [Bacteroidales bacterium]